jgi:tripeptide aminopeptidase
MKITERFLNYITIDTQSDEESETSPSTEKQHNLAAILVKELTEMGAEEIHYDKKHCYVYATIPASKGCENTPVIGFIAHMDTAPSMNGKDVNPRIIVNYTGNDILLNEELNITLKTSDFPEILQYTGQDLIVTDGTTLLGADDKAGIAEIMTMTEYLLTHPDFKHGKIRIGFTPDEEIGCGTNHFDVKLFAAEYAYTVDGGALGELEFENFNAAGAKVTIKGRNVHPGAAKGKMKNSILMAQEFQGMLPVFETPMYTQDYEGFYHLNGIVGTVEETKMDYIIRDHDFNKFLQKKEHFLNIAEFLNKKYKSN